MTTTDITTYASTTTLRRIRDALPCEDGWKKLLSHLGKTTADDEPLDLLTVLNSNGLDDALWVLSFAMPDDRLARHFQAWCAEQVLPLFEVERPNDGRVRAQIETLRNDDATKKERNAAWRAAWDASTVVATVAAWAAARDGSTANSTAAARAASMSAASGAAWAASTGGAWDATRTAQEHQLRIMLGDSK